MLFTLGLDSQFAIVETILSGILDFKPNLRSKKTIVIGIICVIGFFCGLPLTQQVQIVIFHISLNNKIKNYSSIKRMFFEEYLFIFFSIGWSIPSGSFGLLCSWMAIPIYWIY